MHDAFALRRSLSVPERRFWYSAYQPQTTQKVRLGAQGRKMNRVQLCCWSSVYFYQDGLEGEKFERGSARARERRIVPCP